MPQSRRKWTSERRLTREEARSAQTPPVCRSSLAQVVQEQGLSECWCGCDLYLGSFLWNCLPLILPATRMCAERQRRARQPISPFPGRPQGGSSPSLLRRTSLCYHHVSFTTPVASTAKQHKCRFIATSGTTVASAAAIRCVAVPELSKAVLAPALNAPVVLRSAASFNIHSGAGAGCLQGAYQRPASFP